MSGKQMRNEMMYQATMSLARRMRDEGIITEDEYARIDRMFIEKYRPIIGCISSRTS